MLQLINNIDEYYRFMRQAAETVGLNAPDIKRRNEPVTQFVCFFTNSVLVV